MLLLRLSLCGGQIAQLEHIYEEWCKEGQEIYCQIEMNCERRDETLSHIIVMASSDLTQVESGGSRFLVRSRRMRTTGFERLSHD